jgi:hypothetical protein
MRERKWDENWNGLLLATLRCVAVGPTLEWGLMGLPLLKFHIKV